MIYRLTRRNLTVFFRDPPAVFFSLLSSLILFVLFIAFLGNLQTQALHDQLPDASNASVNAFVHSWVLASVVMIATMTTSLSALVVFVNDRVTDGFRDFLVTPATRVQMISGYLLASFVVSMILSSAVLVFSQVFLGIFDHAVLGPSKLFAAFFSMVGFCLLFASIWSFFVTFVKSNAVFMSLGTIIGTAGGFLAGAYITVGTLPTGVVTFMNLLPLNPAATLMRQSFTASTLDSLTSTEQATTIVREEYGLNLLVANTSVSAWLLWFLFVLLFAIFLFIGSRRIGRRLG
ncbi:MAG: ABC transporter permease [Micrococcales bacterium]|nr:ABC transporter permease [Micrococcales bacterium]MCL2667871.1 ABC transporter permease [Micrococcales bacterium]